MNVLKPSLPELVKEPAKPSMLVQRVGHDAGKPQVRSRWSTLIYGKCNISNHTKNQ